MGRAFDQADSRPEEIDQILNGLERYNPETTKTFQDYVTQQCEDKTYDCYANLALLKLYVCDPNLAAMGEEGERQEKKDYNDDRTFKTFPIT